MKAFRFVIHYLKPHYKWAIGSPLWVGLEVVAELVQPFFMARIINEGVLSGNVGQIYHWGIWMVVVSFVGVVGGLLSIFAAGKVSYSFGADMRLALFEKITRFSAENLDKFQTNSLITRITSDVFRVQSVIQSSMRLLFRSPLLFIGAIFMVLTTSAKLSGVLLVLLPVLLFCVYAIIRRAFPVFMTIQKKTDRLNTVVQESLAGVRVIKAYTQEKKEMKRFVEANDDLIDSNLKVSKLVVLLGPVMTFVLNIGIALCVYAGARLMEMEQSVNVGDVMAVTNYLTQILMSLMMAQRIIMSITEAQASLIRLQEVMETDGPVDSVAEVNKRSGGQTDFSIEFDHVWFKYDKSAADETRNYVLKDVSFRLEEGETLGIIGATGSGKSTVAQLLQRFYEADRGTVRIGGRDILAYDKKAIHRDVSLCMQKVLLFSGTLAENLSWGRPEATEEKMMEACRKAQIYEFVQTLDEKLNYKVKQGGVNLSGGQKQRLSIARAFVAQPRVLILDDCMNALDMRTESMVKKELSKMKCTKIIISQRISTLRDADKILLMENGEVLASGTHYELMQCSTVYQEICRTQLL